MIVDRLAVKPSVKRRLTDSVETALGLAGGVVSIDFVDRAADDPERERRYSERLACPNDHDISIEELEPRQFSFNGPWGACPACSGIGTRMEVDVDLVVPDTGKSLADGAISIWTDALRRRATSRTSSPRSPSRRASRVAHPVGAAARAGCSGCC